MARVSNQRRETTERKQPVMMSSLDIEYHQLRQRQRELHLELDRLIQCAELLTTSKSDYNEIASQIKNIERELTKIELRTEQLKQGRVYDSH